MPLATKTCPRAIAKVVAPLIPRSVRGGKSIGTFFGAGGVPLADAVTVGEGLTLGVGDHVVGLVVGVAVGAGVVDAATR